MYQTNQLFHLLLDGIGPDIWKMQVALLMQHRKKAYNAKRIEWKEVLADKSL